MIDPQSLFDAMLLAYAGVGKTGKPQVHEHTILAGVAISFKDPGEPSIERAVFVVLTTGTKCLPEVARHPGGFAVHDSHAEVLARRTLVRWLMDEMLAICEGRRSLVFEKGDGGRICLRQGVMFHLVTSSAPCGDCAVLAPEDDSAPSNLKRQRTGAKVVLNASILPRQENVEKEGQTVGAVRRKPGKGSPTSSTSCSDKILRWMHLGFQGCLLRAVLETPLYFSSLTAACDSEDSLRRGAWDRQPSETLKPPMIRRVSITNERLDELGLCSTESRFVGAGYSVSWWAPCSHLWKPASAPPSVPGVGRVFSEIPKASKEFREVIIGKTGYRAGCLSKMGAVPPPQFHSRVSRSCIRSRFEELVARLPTLQIISASSGDVGHEVEEKHPKPDHREFKRLVCPAYIDAWTELRGRADSVFRTWLEKT